MPESQFQLSEKFTDTAILVVRGENYNEFSNVLHAVAEDQGFHADLMKAVSSINGTKLTVQQAMQNVQQAMPGAQEQQPQWSQPTHGGTFVNQPGQYPSGPPAPWEQQQPQQQQWGGPQQQGPGPDFNQPGYGQQQQAPQQQAQPQGQYTCPHGQRQYKEGQRKNGQGKWVAYFCPVKDGGCKPMNADGTFWK